VPPSAKHMNGYRAVLLGFGCALFVYLLVRLGAAQISSLLLGVGWYFGLIAAIYAGHQLIRAFAYWKCVTANGRSSYWDMVRIRLSGEATQFLTSTGPFLAEPAKVWLLQRRGLSTKRAVAATVLEYLIYALTSAAFALAGLTYLLINFDLSRPASVAAQVVVYAMSAFLLAAIGAISFRIYLIGAIIKGASRLPWIGKHVRLKENDVRDTEDLLFVVLRDRPPRLLLIVAVEFAAQALLVLELFVLLRTTGKPFPILYPFLIEAATKFVGLAFFFIPGQVGAAEGTYAFVFKMVGLPASAGFALALARRLRSFLVAGAGLAFAPLGSDVPPSHKPG
jgi:uncharacterized membrane protein YbhN (UPF0104 family)